MRILLTLFLSWTWVSLTFAQHTSVFDPKEAKEMMALGNSFTYLELYGDDKAIIPAGYSCVYTSPVVGMDNMFQVYTRGKTGVISFRGSTDKKTSWLENIYASMIPVSGTITVQDKEFHYAFGKDTSAHIHSGYALSMAYLHEDILTQIRALNQKGIYQIYITGHSQGGALAILTRAYLEFGVKKEISPKNDFKVYTFAQPMAGNFEFAREYNRNFCDKGRSFSLINPEDKVPTMPMSFNDSTYLRDNLLSLFAKDQEFDRREMVREGLMLLFQDKLKGTVHKFGESVSKQIQKELGAISLPEPTQDINFSQVGNIIYLPPPDYPLELKDSSWLQDTLFMAEHPRDERGIFLDKGVYKKVTLGQNHKPYNYYTAILRKYFPREYDATEPKSFGL